MVKLMVGNENRFVAEIINLRQFKGLNQLFGNKSKEFFE
jgi:hypothetical protein